MSVDNIGRALKVYAGKGGAIDAATFTNFKKMLEDYKASGPRSPSSTSTSWKRIATFTAAGKTVPLCKLNGKTVGMADFYDSVATQVCSAFDRTKLKQSWMADRWGYRSKQLIELMDVVAEQSVRGERSRGPARQGQPQVHRRGPGHRFGFRPLPAALQREGLDWQGAEPLGAGL